MNTVYGGDGGGRKKMEINFYRVFLSCFRKIMLQREPTEAEAAGTKCRKSRLMFLRSWLG